MVRVVGTRGNLVNIHVLGIAVVMDRLRRAGKEIESSVDLGVVKAGAFVEEEVKESIMGNRVELKSVDTGRLGNSIEFNKKGKAHGVVEPRSEKYPNGATTTEVATILEYGTSRIVPRKHFKNTETRTKGKVKDIIANEIKIGII